MLRFPHDAVARRFSVMWRGGAKPGTEAIGCPPGLSEKHTEARFGRPSAPADGKQPRAVDGARRSVIMDESRDVTKLNQVSARQSYPGKNRRSDSASVDIGPTSTEPTAGIPVSGRSGKNKRQIDCTRIPRESSLQAQFFADRQSASRLLLRQLP